MAERFASEGKLLAEHIERNYRTHLEFAEALSISKDKLSNWVTGRTRVPRNRLPAIAALLKVSEDELLKAPRKIPATISEPNQMGLQIGVRIPVAMAGHLVIPVYGSIPAGRPESSYSEAIEFLQIPERAGGEHFRQWGRVVDGDSMLPEFEHGDRIVFENRKAKLGDVVYATKDGRDALKIIAEDREGNGWLCPLNPEFQPFSAEGWQILGVAIMRVRESEKGVKDTREYRLGANFKIEPKK